MKNSPIVRSAQGVTVTRYVDGYPAATVISRDDTEDQLRLFGAEQARGLLWALQEIVREHDDKAQKS